METSRANVTFLINELLEEKLVREGAQGNDKVRGRKPTFLYLNSQKSYAVAVDVRVSKTFMMITDSIGKQIEEIISFPTELNPADFVNTLSKHLRKILHKDFQMSACQGIGIIVRNSR